MTLSYEYRRPTTDSHGHTRVYLNDQYIGYLMPNRSRFAPIGHNWIFRSEQHEQKFSINASNRKDLIKKIEEKYL